MRSLRSFGLVLLSVASACSHSHITRTAHPRPPALRALAVAAGYDHTCALTNTGGVQCWGYNDHGQLGDGTTRRGLTPVGVSGVREANRAIATGEALSCAITRAARVECWGENDHGQLGNGTTAESHVPVGVSGLGSGVRAVAVGEAFGCALTSARGVKCWGDNSHGQLGDGTTADSAVPVDVSGLAHGVRAIVVGYFHACALTAAGALKCWGYNAYGQLGDGTTTDRAVPVDVAGLVRGVTAVSAGGGHTCALTSSGGVKCWGSNAVGELGDGTTSRRLTPVAVSGLARGVVAIAAGGEAHVCALTTGGDVECWGYNGHGQLGDGTTTNRDVPVDVVGLGAGIRSITAGGYGHTCACTSAGEVKCWGRNSSGQLGDGTTKDRHTPVAVATRERAARRASPRARA